MVPCPGNRQTRPSRSLANKHRQLAAMVAARSCDGYEGQEMTDKTSKVAIVTGASRGIGAAVAKRLASDGFAVVINYSGRCKVRRGAGSQRSKPAAAGRSPPRPMSAIANAMRGMFDAAEAAFGGIDVLVNNAGIMKLAKIADMRRLGTVRSADRDQSQGQFQPPCARPPGGLRDGGRIVNFSTSVVGTKLETYSVYAARPNPRWRRMTAILAEGIAWPQHHGQCRGAGAGRDRPVPQWQNRRN